MNRKETHARYAKGKEAWNKWANEMLAERKRLEDAGEWEANRLAWEEKATADFSSRKEPQTFEADVDCSGWVFPGFACFYGATFERNARFDEARFKGTASFDGARFVGDAFFERTKVSKVTRFQGAKFKGHAWFQEARFKKNVWFAETHFERIAWFQTARFKQRTWFSQTTFAGHTSFEDATFYDATDFCAILAERAFTLTDATFYKVPEFIQSRFSEAPRLDNLGIRPGFVKPGDFWLFTQRDAKRQTVENPDLKDEPARWRALKRPAIQAHDHVREQEFFANEIRSAQFVTDWPYGEGWPRFWFGKLYQWFSDFGRSVVRPLVWWMLVAVACFAIYWDQYLVVKAREPLNIQCVTQKVLRSKPPLVPLADGIREQLIALNEAVWLTVGNGAVVGNVIGGAETRRLMYGCLYGLEELRAPSKSAERYVNGVSRAGYTTGWVPPLVSTVSAIQRFLSVIFIFLFGLALRNMLKMK